MGLFSSKTKRYVDTQITRVIDDEHLPTPLKTAVFEAVMSPHLDVATSLTNAALNGAGRKFERMYRYAERGEYIHGLPDLKLFRSNQYDRWVEHIIAQEVEHMNVDDIEFEYVHYRPLNNNHMAWRHLVDKLKYNHETNEIEDLTPEEENPDLREPRYLDKLVAVHHASTKEGEQIHVHSMGVWGRRDYSGLVHSPSNANFDFTESGGIPDEAVDNVNSPHDYHVRYGSDEIESVEIHYSWEEKTATYNDDGDIVKIDIETKEDFLVLELTQYDPNHEYFHAKYSYTVEDDEGEEHTVWKYWFYDIEDGLYPQLDDIFSPRNPGWPGTYFPFAMFRSEQQNKTIDDGSEEFNSTKKLLDYIDINFEELGEAMHAEENEGVEDLRQAVLMMAVPLDSDNQLEMEYLFEFFKDINEQILFRDDDADQPTAEELMGETGGTKSASYAFEISDSDFSMVISFDRIRKRFKTTTNDIGPKGHFTSEVIEGATSELVGDLPDELIEADETEVPKRRVIRKQVMESYQGRPGIIEEIEIDNPVFKTVVRRLEKKTLTVEGGVDDERLLIPLNYEICQKIPFIKREVLYFRSLHFVMNSYVEQKVKWWQKGIWQIIIIVVAVVIAWFTGGWGATLASAATASAAALVILKFIIGFIINTILIEYAFEFVVETIGIEAAFWLAVAATVVGGYKMLNNAAEGVQLASQNAMNYLKAASGLQGGIGSVMQDDIRQLQEEAEAFEAEMEEKQEELDELRKQFISPVDIDPLYFLRRSQPFTMFGEPPDAFFERTTHGGNVGVKTLKIVEQYVDIALTLPKPEHGV